MFLQAIPFPDINPVIFHIYGPLSLRWYGLAYAAGLLLGWLYVRNLIADTKLWSKKSPITKVQCDDLLIWIAAGVVLGGRLGYLLLYKPETFIDAPLSILAVWEGGMSFHGGLIGSILAMYFYSKKHKLIFFSITDLGAAAVPIGLFFGRIANFINKELVGRVTDVPWAVAFEANRLPRHPSQLYEAFFEGIVLFLVLLFFIRKRQGLHAPGFVSGIFLIGYGSARIFCEFFRQPEPFHSLNIGPFTAGMFYSIPMILLGVYMIWQARQPVPLKAG